MKIVTLAIASLIGFSAQAATNVVVSNMFLASGPATKNYFTNLNKIISEKDKVSSAELGLFDFAGAIVDSNSNKVRYTFNRFEKSDVYETCRSEVAFTTSLDADSDPVVSEVVAKLSCSKNND